MKRLINMTQLLWDLFRKIKWQGYVYHLLHCLIVQQFPGRNKNYQACSLKSSFGGLTLLEKQLPSFLVLFNGTLWYFFSTFGNLMKDLLPVWSRLRNNCLTDFPHQLQPARWVGGCKCNCTTKCINCLTSSIWDDPQLDLTLYQAGLKITFVKLQVKTRNKLRFSWCQVI